MGKIILFIDERKTSNNKNLRMKQMTAVDMVRASQATLRKATVWKTRRIHIFGFVFVRKKWKLEADFSSLENPGAPLWKLTVEKVKVGLSSLENRPRQASRRSVGKPLEEDAISPPGWDLSSIDLKSNAIQSWIPCLIKFNSTRTIFCMTVWKYNCAHDY